MSSKITPHPPVRREVHDFILDAEQDAKGTHQHKKRSTYPWNEEYVRSDVQKVFTVKLPEESILKIRYASEMIHKSQQKIVRDIICEGVDKLLRTLGVDS